MLGLAAGGVAFLKAHPNLTLELFLLLLGWVFVALLVFALRRAVIRWEIER